jgi:hypothetical protein
MLDRRKTSHQLNIAYLFQSIGTKFSESRAEQLHTLYTIRGLQRLQHHAVLLALYGQNVILSGDLESITSDKLLDNHFARLVAVVLVSSSCLSVQFAVRKGKSISLTLLYLIVIACMMPVAQTCVVMT